MPTAEQTVKHTPLVGSTWKDASGRKWEVMEMVRPNCYRVGTPVTGQYGGKIYNRIGEMNALNLRTALSNASKE